MKKDNVFFSIIIPTYNPKKFLPRLLESITHNECIDKIEVIISDDCSTEPFAEVLVPYIKKLHMRVISNEKHAGFPRDGRQHGSEEAKGVWFCFSDQDDYFVDNAFDKIYSFIQEKKAKNYIVADFIEEAVDTGERKLNSREKGWTHGKFYEKAFWKKYDIKYDKVKYCEDINLSLKINCIVSENHIPIFEYGEPLYVWCRRNDSLADMKYFADSMPDYSYSTLSIIMDYIEKHKPDEELYNEFCVKFVGTFLHTYFYFQSSILYDKRQLLLETVRVIQPLFTRFKEATGLTNDTFVQVTSNELQTLYQKTRNDDFNQVHFIEQIAFKDWVDLYFD